MASGSCRVYEEAGNADSGRWFPGARGNIAEMALAGGNTGNTAIVWAEEGEPRALHHMSLGELRDISTRIGARLVALGRKPGMLSSKDNPLECQILLKKFIGYWLFAVDSQICPCLKIGHFIG